MSGVRKHETYTGTDPVYGETGHHATETGAKAEGAWHDIKAAVPGTQEHQMKEGVQTRSGYASGATGTHTGTHTGTGAGMNQQPHFVSDPATGEVRTHKTAAGAAIDETAQKVKAAIPGTAAHDAAHGTGTTGVRRNY